MTEKHTHTYERQMGPGPSHACECGATKHMGNPYKASTKNPKSPEANKSKSKAIRKKMH